MRTTSSLSPLFAFLLLAAAVIFIGISISSAQAQTYSNVYWAANSTNLGGSGTWNTSLTNWSTNPAGGVGTTIISPNSTNAIFNFSGTAGTVTESSSFSIGGLNILSSGYIFTNTANRTWTGDTNTGVLSLISLTNNANVTLTGTSWRFDALTMTGGTGATLTISNTTVIFGSTGLNGGRTNFVNTVVVGATNALGTQSVTNAFTQAGNITNNATMLVITNSANNNTATIAGQISGSGAVTLVNSGSSTTSVGKIALSASNTYSGGSTLNALAFFQTFSTNSSNGVVTTNLVNSGLNNIRIADSSAFGTGTITAAGPGTNNVRATIADLNVSNAVTLNSGSTLFMGVTNSGYKLTLSGVISGSGVLGADSGATVILATNNTYSGTTIISSGTLQVGNAGTAGTLGTGDVVNNDKLAFDRSDSFTLSNNISGAGSVSKSANGPAGILTLAGSNSYTGTTTIGSGTIRIATINALPAGNVLLGSSSVNNFSTFDLALGGAFVLNSFGSSSSAGGFMIFTNSSGSSASLTFTGATNYITLSSGTSSGRTVANLSTNLSLVFNGAVDIGSSTANDVTFNSVGSTVVNGSIFNTNTAVRGLSKSGVGALTLAGSNSFNGATAVYAGTLRLANSYALGAANGLTNSVSSGAAIELQGGITVDGETLSLNGRGVNDDGALRNIVGNNTFNGTIQLNSTNRINSDAGTLTIGAVITNTSGKALSTTRSLLVGGAGNIAMASDLDGSGSGRLIKDGTGTLTISAANTVNGGITVGAGSIIVSSTGSINEADSSVIISNGANLRYDGTTSLRVASVSVEQGGGLDVGPSGSMLFVAGTNGVNTVSGAGTATFQGAFNVEISAAATNAGSSWPLVSVASPSYTGSFNVAGFTNSGGTWTCGSNGVTYQFSQSTGILSVASSTPVNAYNSWLTNYSTLSNTNGNADPDGDGFNNNMEFAFDGNPTVGSPAMISAASSAAGTVFSFLASTNANAVTYVVQSTTDLSTVPWADNSSVTASITNSSNQVNVPLAPSYVRREFTVTPAGSKFFYRVKATIAP